MVHLRSSREQRPCHGPRKPETYRPGYAWTGGDTSGRVSRMSAFPHAEDWAAEFAESTAFSFLPAKEDAAAVCADFLRRCRESTEAELRRVLLDEMPSLDLPTAIRTAVPETLAALLTWLEDSGRLAGG